jgi:hypothetical protein
MIEAEPQQAGGWTYSRPRGEWWTPRGDGNRAASAKELPVRLTGGCDEENTTAGWPTAVRLCGIRSVPSRGAPSRRVCCVLCVCVCVRVWLGKNGRTMVTMRIVHWAVFDRHKRPSNDRRSTKPRTTELSTSPSHLRLGFKSKAR